MATDTVESSLADLRDIPLAEMSQGIVGEAIRRALPEHEAATVPVAAFQSAI